MHPVGKNYASDQKTIRLFDDLHELYQHAKFGGDRTTRAGCRCESVMFVTMFCLSRSQAGALFVRGDIVQTGVSLPFIGLFQRGFMFFFRWDCSYTVHFLSLGSATIFEKLRSKIAKSAKIGGKVCAHHFV